ncbi:diacylglycerol/lipid kinase family protein [Paucibacter sp. XJ19-41]|uniref:diacylglycerol/lipid kinase family protein n=1 Tax=Paucibacter sp. XJ19-41 TaxID=2927824 RepID=UPI00234B3932|nr:diacylglycerol kinase family protein [Paucibacter sp. XJ19-41]MDC6165817.1 diacylglycerol kinase family protein [Paucibacter sp. XJ19-41]
MTTAAPALFVIFNRGSGHGEAAELQSGIEAACREAGRELHLQAVSDPRQIHRIARETVQRAQAVRGIVVAAGGDGTINAVAQAVLGSGCAFGVLPRGTFNYFSRTHGIPAELDAALQVLLHESPQLVQVGLVNDRVFLVNASLGLYPKLLEDREYWKKQLGRSRPVAFLAGLLTLMQGHSNLRLSIELRGETHAVREIRTPTLFVGNNALQMEQIGLPEAQAIDAGQLAGITLRPLGRWALLGLLLRGALGRLGEASQLFNFSFACLTVRASRRFGLGRIKLATDGEIVWMKLPLQFRVAPEPLLLIRPPGPAAERAAEPGAR